MNIYELLAEYAKYKRLEEDAKKQAQEIRKQIVQYLQSNNIDSVGSEEHKATYKGYNSTRLNTARLKALYPNEAAACMETKIEMRFYFK